MTGFTDKKSYFRLKLALFDSSLENLQIRQGVALLDQISQKFVVALFGVSIVTEFMTYPD